MFTIDEFQDWLHGKDRDHRFHYGSTGNCLLAQFLQDRHPDSDILVGGYTYDVDENIGLHIPTPIAVALDKAASGGTVGHVIDQLENELLPA